MSGKTSLVVRILFDEFEDTYGGTIEDNYYSSLVVGLTEHSVDILDIGGMDVYKNEYDRVPSFPALFF